MQITIDLPDALEISEVDLRTELAISLFQHFSKNAGLLVQRVDLLACIKLNFSN